MHVEADAWLHRMQMLAVSLVAQVVKNLVDFKLESHYSGMGH